MEAAGLTSAIPFSGFASSGSYAISGHTPAAGEPDPHGRITAVSGDFFEALQIPLLAGRLFDTRDTHDAPRVVIVDQLLADRYFSGRDPVGRHIHRPDGAGPWTIIGVVGTVNTADLTETVAKEGLYFPATQLAPATMGLVVRNAGDPLALTAAVRSAVRAIDPEQPVHDVRTMDEWVARSLQERRTPVWLLAAFAALALTLSGVGLYGVVGYAVGERRREIGLRRALGASPWDVARLLLRQALRPAIVGLAAGLAGAALAGRFMASLLSASDRMTQACTGWPPEACSPWRSSPRSCRSGGRFASIRPRSCGRHKAGAVGGEGHPVVSCACWPLRAKPVGVALASPLAVGMDVTIYNPSLDSPARAAAGLWRGRCRPHSPPPSTGERAHEGRSWYR